MLLPHLILFLPPSKEARDQLGLTCYNSWATVFEWWYYRRGAIYYNQRHFSYYSRGGGGVGSNTFLWPLTARQNFGEWSSRIADQIFVADQTFLNFLKPSSINSKWREYFMLISPEIQVSPKIWAPNLEEASDEFSHKFDKNCFPTS